MANYTKEQKTKQNISWNRKEIFDLLNKVYKTFSLGQQYIHSDKPYIVIKKSSQQTSIDNDIGCWQIYDIMCYSPDKSPVLLDEVTKRVYDLLKGKRGLEVIGFIGEEYHDVEINMFERTIQIRVPKEV